MFTTRLRHLFTLIRILTPDGDAPLRESDRRLRELLRAHAEGTQMVWRSDLEIRFLYFTGVVVVIFFLGWGIWSHYGDKALRAKRLQGIRSPTKRRSKRRRRVRR
ncbi:hypothetical protein [Massilia sp. 9096]|uniref:hypothetical protein n=1 Tax=Massilia sp. 9096 TaxID=1500894 RepID=UPI00055CB69E|nr:hypothetical protein [Massilia sp. 9096]